MMTRSILLSFLLLAACQAAPDVDAAHEASKAEAPIREVETLPPDETVVPKTVDPAGAPSPTVAAIPESFHGRWGLVPADCTSTRGDAKGLLIIGAQTLQFYESRAKLVRIVHSWPEKLEAEFAFNGEGQEWTRPQTLALTGSSNTLIRSEEGGEFRYKRCPA